MQRIRASFFIGTAVGCIALIGCSDDAETGDPGGAGASGSGQGSGGQASSSGGGPNGGSGPGGTGVGGTGSGGEGGNGAIDLFPSRVPAGFVLHDLGDVPVNGGTTASLAFEATADTRAFHVVGVGAPDSFVIVLEAIAPDGTEYIRTTADPGVDPGADGLFLGFAGPGTSPNRSIARPAGVAALIPNTPALPMQVGTWQLKVGNYHVQYDDAALAYANEPVDGAVHVGIVERTIDPVTAGAIDLALLFGPGASIDATSAKTDAVLQASLDQLSTILDARGLALGEVTYTDAPGVAATIDLGGVGCPGGPATVAALAGAPEAPPRALRIVFTETFFCEGPFGDIGPYLAAISNGLPGIPFARHDGLLVTTVQKDEYPEDWALVLAHELGHFVGLAHTCDNVPGVCDNIADTPEGEDASANLMFPNVSQVTSPTLTPDQVHVLRLSPLFH